jgi:hypothetical protein
MPNQSYDGAMGLLRRALLGDGRLPDDLRAQLSADQLLLLEEDLSGSITYRGFRGPGRRSSLEKTLIAGAVAISSTRIVVWIGRGKPMDVGKHLDVAFADDRVNGLEVVAESPDRVCIAYDPAAFDPQKSGRVELRLKTPKAAEIVTLIRRG